MVGPDIIQMVAEAKPRAWKLVSDNTDQQGEKFQETVFLLAHEAFARTHAGAVDCSIA